MASNQLKAMFCFLTIGIFIGLEFIYYYLDDFLDEGRSFFFLNSYNQGLFTWVWDFTWYWGYFELSILKACIIAGYILYYMPKSAVIKKKVIQWPSFWLCLGIIILGLFFWSTSPGYPENYNAGQMIIHGWYDTYFARHLLEVILLATGFWMLPIVIQLHQKRKCIQRNNSTLYYLGLMSALIILHMALVGSFSLENILNLVHPLESLISLLGFILPLTIGTILFQLESDESKNTKSNEILIEKQSSLSLINWRDYFWLLGSFIGLCLIVGVGLWSKLDTGIEISSRFIPNMFFSNLFTGSLSSLIVFLALKLKQQISKSEENRID